MSTSGKSIKQLRAAAGTARMSIKELRVYLDKESFDYSGCLEKSDLIALFELALRRRAMLTKLEANLAAAKSDIEKEVASDALLKALLDRPVGFKRRPKTDPRE